MADGYKLWQVCPVCQGDGTNDNGWPGSPLLIECWNCGGTGYKFFGWCSVDTYEMPTDLPDEP